jgi:hypothetical protein
MNLTISEFSSFSSNGQNRLVKEFGKTIFSKVNSSVEYAIIKIYDFILIGLKKKDSKNGYVFYPTHTIGIQTMFQNVNLN